MRTLLLVVVLLTGVLRIGGIAAAQTAGGTTAPPPLAGVWKGTAAGGSALQNVVLTITETGQVSYGVDAAWAPQIALNGAAEATVVALTADTLVFTYLSQLPNGSTNTIRVELHLVAGQLVGKRAGGGEAPRYLTLTRTP